MKKSNNIKLFAGLLALLISACGSDKEGIVTISGTVENPSEKGIVTLVKLTAGSREVLDTLILDEKNNFETTLPAGAPEFYQVNFYNVQVATLIAGKEDINIIVDGTTKEGKMEITGSDDVANLQAIQDLVKKENNDVAKINSDYIKARNSNNVEAMKNIEDDFTIIQEKKKERIKQQVETMLPSIAVIQAMNFFDPNADFDFMQKVSNELYGAHPESAMVKFYKEQMDGLALLAVGATAPDFSMPNVEGDTVSLSDFRGGYVLVDFWAAWCKPCRQENPNLVAAYNKFKDNGLRVLGVSLDRSREDWLKAIEVDNLEWTHVSELKYWQTPIVQEYKISGIPFSLLVGPDGKIVAKNLRGEKLHEKLAEIYGKKNS